MRAQRTVVVAVIVLIASASSLRADDVDDDGFHLLMVQRKLPTPETLDQFTDQVTRMRRVGASNAELAERMSVLIDQRLEASNKPQGESLFNPMKKGAIADRARRWQQVDDVMKGNDGLPGKAVPDGRLGARLAEAAWNNQVGNCCESANVAYEALRRAGIPARLFNTSSGGAHEFVVIGLNANADPNDPTTWGENARVVDGWIGRSLTPQEAFENPHIFNGRKTNAQGNPLITDQTNAYDNPQQEKSFNAMGNKGAMRVEVVDEAGNPVPGALVRLKMDEPQEKTTTAQGIDFFTT